MVSFGGSEMGLELTAKDQAGTLWDYGNVLHGSNMGACNCQNSSNWLYKTCTFSVFKLEPKKNVLPPEICNMENLKNMCSKRSQTPKSTFCVNILIMRLIICWTNLWWQKSKQWLLTEGEVWPEESFSGMMKLFYILIVIMVTWYKHLSKLIELYTYDVCVLIYVTSLNKIFWCPSKWQKWPVFGKKKCRQMSIHIPSYRKWKWYVFLTSNMSPLSINE